MKDIVKDGQRFVFEGYAPGPTGTMLRYSGQCAICGKRIEFSAKSFGRAAATPLRRCTRHKVPGAAIGSKAEAIAIATHGWRVVSGSVVDLMRKDGRAWKATVTLEPPGGRIHEEKPGARKDELLGNAYFMVQSFAKYGPCSPVIAAEGSDMSYEYAYVLAGRLVAKGMLSRTRHGGYEATDKGRKALSDPRHTKLDTTSADRVRPAVGLFD